MWDECSQVVGCTHLSDKELHIMIGVGTMVTLGSIDGVMVSTLAWNARDAGSIPALGTIYPVFITPTTE